MLLLTGLAFAHRPHTPVTALAVEGESAWIIEDPQDLTQLMSGDALGFAVVGGEPQQESLVDLALLDGRAYALGEQLWTYEDGRWSGVPTGATALDVAGGELTWISPDGFFAGQERLAEGDFVALRGAVAVTATGAVYRGAQALGEAGAVEAADSGSEVVAITGPGAAIRLDEGGTSWEPCSAPPSPAVEIGAGEGVVMLGLDTGELAISEDGCGSWEIVSAGLEVDLGGIGDAQSPEQLVTAIVIGPDRWWVAGFAGVRSSTDRGATWTAAALIPADLSRGLTFSGRTLIAAGYGSGAAWTEDGLSWEGSAVGLVAPYAYGIAADGRRLWASFANRPFSSEDGGASWARMTLDMERVRRFVVHGDELWALGERQDGGIRGELSVSKTNGRSWYPAEVPEGLPRDVLPDGSLLTDRPAALWREGEALIRVEDENAAGAALLGRRIVFASASGVWLLDPREEPRAVTGLPPGPPRLLAASSEGDLLLITRSGHTAWSEDRGESWISGDPLLPAAFEAAARDDGIVVVATQEGLYWSCAEDRTWHPISRFARIEADTVHVRCAGACSTYRDEEQGDGGGLLLSPGDVVELPFQGESAEILAEGDFSSELSGDGVWRLLRLEAEGVVELDAVVVRGPGEGLPPGGCAGALPLGLLLTLPAGRRRGTASTRGNPPRRG